jgi:hypothetical protein
MHFAELDQHYSGQITHDEMFGNVHLHPVVVVHGSRCDVQHVTALIRAWFYRMRRDSAGWDVF